MIYETGSSIPDKSIKFASSHVKKIKGKDELKITEAQDRS
jgi:hypothetical protein